jgi:hypothetical protein
MGRDGDEKGFSKVDPRELIVSYPCTVARQSERSRLFIAGRSPLVLFTKEGWGSGRLNLVRFTHTLYSQLFSKSVQMRQFINAPYRLFMQCISSKRCINRFCEEQMKTSAEYF